MKMDYNEMDRNDVDPSMLVAIGHDGATILRINAPTTHRVYVNDVLVGGVVATDATLTTWRQVP